MSSPERIHIGKSNPRLEYIQCLQDAWRSHDLVLFIGAGLSTPYKIPTWKDLVLQLVLETEPKFEQFWPEYQTPLANWMATEYCFDLLALSRVVKYMLDDKKAFAEAVRRRLYAVWKSPKMSGMRRQKDRNTALSQLANSIKRAKDEGRGPVAVVTMNFDNLLEQELERAGVEYQSIYDQNIARGRGIPIIHPHGFLPEEGEIQNLDLVFSEDEYHQLSHSPFHWAVTEMQFYLRRNPTLFLGLSMSDQTLRRLLDATIPRDASGFPSEPFRRFVLRRDYSQPENNHLEEAIDRIEKLADEIRTQNGYVRKAKTPGGVKDAIESMVKQAHTFDRRLFKDMGVGVVWFREFEDIPKILDVIAEDRSTVSTSDTQPVKRTRSRSG